MRPRWWFMDIFPDPMLVLVQVAPFLVLLAGLHVILFKPTLDYLDARRAATDGARAEAARMQGNAGAALDRYEQAVAAARAEIAELRASRRAQANEAHARRVALAREAAEAETRAAVEHLRVEVKTARAELPSRAAALATDMADRVLGRPLSREAGA
jgi:F-type H+-transporting ATPase subunit b